MAKQSDKLSARSKRIRRIRKKISGTPEHPRMRVFRSNRHIYVQIIDDTTQKTLVSMSSDDKSFDGSDIKGKKEKAAKVGEIVAQRAIEAGINKVVFDRGGNLYHGRVKALSEGARKGGLVL
ncbi:50S ribosomal protein L18 [Desulfobulbus sp. US1]|uniref:Large ribosomal subunit protein uL18 n=1 Tax=Candidatus Electrothrix communis TaxID=1859133 RepID=A0A444J590_9BACT|nr:50S ribosomal protein L18 [Desulfobulbus sp. US4]MCW5208838.1 50S ribosomal protein L18 [Desulfobulbus sp. US1]MCW5210435.1 50S ribosomal protein L18 [Desulfobulbus sp. N3]MCW5213878.1 50S ribosomal protein L18 [Desulfobulbus sp. US5]RWX48237.1 large subunit ribosomal protein L18 [Candidatus Electrothrix communis]